MALPTLSLPSYELQLPSNGKTIKFRPFMVKEEKVLLLALEERDPGKVLLAIKSIIETCTFNEVKFDELPQVDLEFLFIMIRNKSLGEGVDIKVECRECHKHIPMTANLDKVFIEKSDNYNPEIKLSDKVWVIMKQPTLNQTFMLGEDSTDAEVQEMIASCIETLIINDQTYTAESQTKEELINFIESLPQIQLDLIRDFFRELPKMVFEEKFKCPHCGTDNIVRLEGLDDFFA